MEDNKQAMLNTMDNNTKRREAKLRELTDKKGPSRPMPRENRVEPLQLLDEPKRLMVDKAKPKTKGEKKNKVELLQLPQEPKGPKLDKAKLNTAADFNHSA